MRGYISNTGWKREDNLRRARVSATAYLEYSADRTISRYKDSYHPDDNMLPTDARTITILLNTSTHGVPCPQRLYCVSQFGHSLLTAANVNRESNKNHCMMHASVDGLCRIEQAVAFTHEPTRGN